MTEEFEAGVDWFIKMQSIFTPAEARLIWVLLKADGRVVPREELERAITGRMAFGTNVLSVHVNRVRTRARGLGLEIVTERGLGCRMDLHPESSFYSSARAIVPAAPTKEEHAG